MWGRKLAIEHPFVMIMIYKDVREPLTQRETKDSIIYNFFGERTDIILKVLL